MADDLVTSLITRGWETGCGQAASSECIVVSECVPGGTSTALGVLSALGVAARGLISSSVPQANHDARWQLVEQGLANASRQRRTAALTAVEAIAALGDPMQAFAAGIACGATEKGATVILAGGSQMLAVAELCRRLLQERGISAPAPVTITTRWVAFDRSAGVAKLSAVLDLPFIAGAPDFSRSRHTGLRAYEQQHVKEGVGAGAAMALAHLVAGRSADEIVQAVDEAYSQLVTANLARETY